MKGLFLYGLNCKMEIWKDIKPSFSDEMIFCEYPHEVTKSAHSVKEITQWVFETYGNQKYDFIVGHSMGGIIGLQLIHDFSVKCEKILLIETNLKPAKAFYRNLLTPKHMEAYGNKIIEMLKNESQFYTKEVMQSLQEDFDFCHYVKNIGQEIHGIYGDRGIEMYPNRMNDLQLDDDTIQKIKFHFVKDSCHMPMIENPKELFHIIQSIIYC